MKKPILDGAIFHFSQEGNCNGSKDEYELLTVEFESSLGLDNDGDGFFVLKTSGWSIDGVEDLEELFNRIRKIINK